MKPFNLTKALAGEPVITRNGVLVSEIHHFKTETTSFPIIAIINGIKESFTLEGHYYVSCSDENGYDLFMLESLAEAWVNVYYDEGGCFTTSRAYNTEQEAFSARYAPAYIKTIKVNNKPE